MSTQRWANLRDQMFRPKPRVKSLAGLNAWLEDQCIAYAKRIRHPDFKDRTIWDVFQEERASLMELLGPFDGFVEKAVRASTTCLIMADHNRYSVDARAAGRMVLVRSHAERIVVLLGDEVVAEHPRQFRRDQIIYDPWHYLPVLMKKPGQSGDQLHQCFDFWNIDYINVSRFGLFGFRCLETRIVCRGDASRLRPLPE